jgi:hypothetical protein
VENPVERSMSIRKFIFQVRAQRSNPSLKLLEAGRKIYEIGDFDFNNENHHGTPDERKAAAEEGYRLGYDGSSFDEAFSTGVEYILRSYA